MKVEFRDKDNNILTLTDFNDFKYYEAPSSNDFKTNNKLYERFATDGAYETGDGTIDARTGNVGLTFVTRTDLEYLIYSNRISNFFIQDQAPFYIVDLDSLRRQKISYGGIDSGFNHGQEMRFVKHSIRYTAIDPFWESLTPITTTATALASGATFNVNVSSASPMNGVGVYNAYPVISITTLANNANFAITNETNNGSFNIFDAAFTTGQTIIVNTEDGSIKKGTVINSRILAAGRPFKLKSGTNTILYQSSSASAATIVITHRNRYLY